ncbi:MAG: hypothetical protein AABY79_06525 [Nitrospirota bacterium]
MAEVTYYTAFSLLQKYFIIAGKKMNNMIGYSKTRPFFLLRRPKIYH